MLCNIRILLLLCYAAALTACARRITAHTSLSPEGISLNQEVKDSKGNPELLGPCTRERLQQPPFDSWFLKNYRDYTVDSLTAAQLTPLLRDKQLTIFMGTWCGDSRREVPRMYKILDCCGVPSSAVRLILLSSADSLYKKSPGHEEQGLHIIRIPDLIVYRKGRETGRIIEYPVVSLEKDLLAILSGQSYVPHYADGSKP